MINTQATTSIVLMIEPAAFHYNEQTAESNYFMKPGKASIDYQKEALREFNGLVYLLRNNGIEVIVLKDKAENQTPDSIFPNNWLSTHAQEGRMVLYPMLTVNRRRERQASIINTIKEKYRYEEITDLHDLERQGLFLEGTGSLILDRVNKVAYCALSDRATEKALAVWMKHFTKYKTITFRAYDLQSQEIYHTNVMMSVAQDYAIVCLESIKSISDRERVVDELTANKKEIIEISLEQVYQYAGNMLELHNAKREKLLVMSTAARNSLSSKQVIQLESHAKLIHTNLKYIEQVAGGSVRCMMCEIFPPSQT